MMFLCIPFADILFSVGLAMGRIPKHEIMINCCIPSLEMAVFPARL